MMDAVGDPAISKIVCMKSAQIGWTEMLNNVIGYFMANDPCPILVVQPTLSMCQAWSKDRLNPMLRDTPVLRGTVGESKSRDSENTVLHKKFNGGHLTAIGANSPSGLASRPIRLVICDEISRFPRSAGTEGNPRALAEKRQKTFWNRKTLLGGTPTIAGSCETEAEFEFSDQRHYYVPCPHCHAKQTMKWRQVRWPTGEPEKAGYFCEECDQEIPHAAKHDMLMKGEWQAHQEFKGTAGFFINELYSPWVTWQEMAADFIKAKQNPETLQTFVNTSLAQTYEDPGEQRDPVIYYNRREEYESAPEGVKLITVAVDVQKNRLEYELVGWGEGKENWGLKYRIIPGDPNSHEVWDQLTKELRQSFPHEVYGGMFISAGTIDSGGHHTQVVYDYCKPENRPFARFYAIKGMDGEGRPIANPRDVIGYPHKKKVLIVGVDTAKSTVYSYLDVAEPGPGYCHFPMSYDEEYFKQLTAEKIVTKYSRGFPKRVWEKTRARNESLDIRAYNFAALQLLNPDLKVVAIDIERVIRRPSEARPKPPKHQPAMNRKKGSWFKRK